MRINNMDGSLDSIPDAHVSAVHACYRLLGFSLFLQFLGSWWKFCSGKVDVALTLKVNRYKSYRKVAQPCMQISACAPFCCQNTKWVLVLLLEHNASAATISTCCPCASD